MYSVCGYHDPRIRSTQQTYRKSSIWGELCVPCVFYCCINTGKYFCLTIMFFLCFFLKSMKTHKPPHFSFSSFRKNKKNDIQIFHVKGMKRTAQISECVIWYLCSRSPYKWFVFQFQGSTNMYLMFCMLITEHSARFKLSESFIRLSIFQCVFFIILIFSVRFQCVYNIFAKSIYRIISGKTNICYLSFYLLSSGKGA